MKKFNLLSLVVIPYTIYLLLNTGVANAEGVSLKIMPTLIQIKIQTPGEIDSPLTIENLGNDSVRLKAELKSFKASDMNNGQVEYQSAPPNFGNNTIKLFDEDAEIQDLTLGPRQKKTFTLKISTPSQDEITQTVNQNDTDYYFSVLFTSIPEPITSDKLNLNSYSRISAGVASNVLLSIQYQGEAVQTPTGEIEELTVPTGIQSGPVPFKVLVKNTGPHFIAPSGMILVKNMFGQTVGKVNIQPANILSNSSRYLPNTVWKEKFLLGFYNVELSIKLSDHGPVLTKSLKFFVFPTQLAINAGIIAILLIIIYSRVKKKL